MVMNCCNHSDAMRYCLTLFMLKLSWTLAQVETRYRAYSRRHSDSDASGNRRSRIVAIQLRPRFEFFRYDDCEFLHHSEIGSTAIICLQNEARGEIDGQNPEVVISFT